MVKLKLAKWQGPVVPDVRHEPAQIVQEVPPLNLWPHNGTVTGRHVYTKPKWADVVPSTEWASMEARIAAWAKEQGLVEVESFHDERIFEPIATESDADRLEVQS